MSDWDDRILCDDGACTGVIGDRGVCTVCGKPGARTPAADRAALAVKANSDGSDHEAPDHDEPDSDDDDADDSDHQDSDHDPSDRDQPTDGVEVAAEASGGDRGWSERQLCPDGGCVGVVHNRRCNVCGTVLRA